MNYREFFQNIADMLTQSMPPAWFEYYTCPEEEIAKAEKRLGFSIPPAIRACISVMGGNGEYQAYELSGIPTLGVMNNAIGAAEDLGANGPILNLDAGQGYACLYAELSGAEDPAIYVVTEPGIAHVAEGTGNPRNVAPTYTSYIRESAIAELLPFRIDADGNEVKVSGDDKPFSLERRAALNVLADADKRSGTLTTLEAFEQQWWNTSGNLWKTHWWD